MEHSINDGDAWGDRDDNDYFNDNPNARPPSPQPQPRQRIPSEYASPPSNLPVSDGVYSSVKESTDKYVYDTPREEPLIDFSDAGKTVYDNSGTSVVIYLSFHALIKENGYVHIQSNLFIQAFDITKIKNSKFFLLLKHSSSW